MWNLVHDTLDHTGWQYTCYNAYVISIDCNADQVTIDDVSVAAGGNVTIEFSSDPNARFRCKLNNQRPKQCECA